MQTFLSLLQNLKQIKVIILALLAIFIFILIIVLDNQKIPTLKSHTPSNTAANVPLNAPIILVFDRDNINPNQFQIKSNPTLPFVLEKGPTNTLIVNHELYFLQNTIYKIIIYYQGAPISDFQFKTSKAENNPQALQLLERQIKEEYPLIDDLPPDQISYTVAYSRPKTIEITILDNKVDATTILAEINEWFNNKGVDPATHQFIFVDQALPSPTTYR